MQPEKPYEFTDAVFYLFKVMGRRPAAVLWVVLWNSVLYLILTALLVWALLPFYLNMLDLAMSGHDPEPSEILTMFASIAWVGLLSFFGGIAVLLMAQGSWLRLLARNEVARGIPLRFGADEFRLLGVNFLLWLIFVAVTLGVWVVMIILLTTTVVAGGDDGGAALAGLLGVLIFFALLVFSVFLGIRLSSAPALTVLDQGVRFSSAWPVTKGIFWWVFLTYLVLGLIIAIASSVISSFVQLMFFPVILPLMTEITQNPGNTDPDAMMALLRETFTSPGTLTVFGVAMVISVFFQMFYDGAWHSVGAYLARRHRGLEGEPAEPSAPASPTPPPTPVAPAANTGDAGGDSGSSPN